MTKVKLAIIALVVLIGVVIFITSYLGNSNPPSNAHTVTVNTNLNLNTNTSIQPSNTNIANNSNSNANTNTKTTSQSVAVLPMKDFLTRVTLKHFGTYITPATSPVQPERFGGYHAGADAEATTASEKDADVPIFAVADGTIVVKKSVSGYGGVVMLESKISGSYVTFLYGHVRLSSIVKNVGETVKKGDQLGVLGTGYSSETDNERKHLHFAILKGKSTRVTGYVSVKSALTSWYDPETWLKDKKAQEP